ncbi:hypothetical protein T484DRAFT_1604794, partial [Baffinella frigidus]
VKYAQRVDSIYVTVEVPDATNARVVVTEDSLVVEASSCGREYAMDVKLFKKAN